MQVNQRFSLSRRRFLCWGLTASGAILLSTLGGCQPQREKCSLDTLNIVPRAGWGAAEPRIEDSAEGVYNPVTNPEGWMVYDEPLEEVLTTIVVHHSALPTSDGPREIQQLHFEARNYADIAYHFVIDTGGWIYEGRSLNVRGSHTGGHNTGTVGIVLLGNFQEIEPTDAQIETLRSLSTCLIDRYGITHIGGHRDFQPGVTECPGEKLAVLLPEVAADLGVQYGIEGYNGP
jgi:hypothetical protein